MSQFIVRATPVTSLLFSPRPTFLPVVGLNLPRVRTSPPGDGPTVIPPSPRDVPEASGFLRLSEIRPLPVVSDGAILHAVSNTVPDGRLIDVSGADGAEAPRGVSGTADLGRGFSAQGAAADVFSPQRPPIASDGDLPPRADPDYFGRGVFDYLDATATVPALR